MIEYWWDIPLSTNTEYQASTLGRIRTKNNGYVHKPAPDLDGYLTVRLSGKTYRVHRLIALTFLGERKAGLQVAHGDGDNQNNNLMNLRYDTVKSNHEDKQHHGTIARGERNGNARLNAGQVREIKRRIASGESSLSISFTYGVVEGTVDHIRRGRTWRHI